MSDDALRLFSNTDDTYRNVWSAVEGKVPKWAFVTWPNIKRRERRGRFPWPASACLADWTTCAVMGGIGAIHVRSAW